MKRLVLLGAGPAHQAVLQALAAQPLPGTEVALIAGSSPAWHEPLVPAWVAGRLPLERCSLPVQAWAQAAGVQWVEATAARLDTAQRQVVLHDGRLAEYDLLSLDLPPAIDRDGLPGACRHALFARPLGPFTRLCGGLWALAQTRPLDVVVLGADTLAVGLALALQHRLGQGRGASRVALVGHGLGWMPGAPPAFAARAAAWLAQRRITWIDQAAVALDGSALHLANGARLACDAAVVATPPGPPAAWAGSGLALDDQGWPLFDALLQNPARPEVLVAAPGAAATATLVHNLRRLAGGGVLQTAPAAASAAWWLDGGDGQVLWGGRWGALQGRWLRPWFDRQWQPPVPPWGAEAAGAPPAAARHRGPTEAEGPTPGA
ncbi:MAG: FAD-dependent oxidoreductase [Rubrivivax sp.]